MLAINGWEWRAIEQKLFVGDNRIGKVFVGDTQVYPEIFELIIGTNLWGGYNNRFPSWKNVISVEFSSEIPQNGTKFINVPLSKKVFTWYDENLKALYYGYNYFGQFPNTLPKANVDCSGMFQECRDLINIDFSYIDWNKVEKCYKMFHNCRNFNQSITIPDTVINCGNMFCNCESLDCPVIFGSNVVECGNMFYGCNVFNQNITIPDTVTNCGNMFYNCKDFDPLIMDLGNGVVNCANMFSMCVSFSGTEYINIPNTAINCHNMFDHCHALIAKVNIGSNVVICDNMFYYCNSFDHSITIPDSVTSCKYMFQHCHSLDHPVTIGNNVVNCFNMFYYCNKFDCSVVIPPSVINAYSMFRQCHTLNQRIIMGTSIENCCDMFSNCRNFDQSVDIPATAIDLASMFAYCENFNQPVNIPDGAINCRRMFYECHNFNQPINIPDSVGNCSDIFRNCSNLDQMIVFGNNVTGGVNLRGSYNFFSDIYINNSASVSSWEVSYMPGRSVRYSLQDTAEVSFVIYKNDFSKASSIVSNYITSLFDDYQLTTSVGIHVSPSAWPQMISSYPISEDFTLNNRGDNYIKLGVYSLVYNNVYGFNSESNKNEVVAREYQLTERLGGIKFYSYGT